MRSFQQYLTEGAGILTGTVRSISGRQVEVHSPNAPAHLQTLFVPRPPNSDPAIGDIVKLKYYSSSSFGYWSITTTQQMGEARDLTKVTNDPRYKKLDAPVKKSVDFWLYDEDDPKAVEMALKALDRFAPQIDPEHEKFKRIFDARPVFYHDSKNKNYTTGPMENRLNAFMRDMAAYYRKHFGGEKIWTDALLSRMFRVDKAERPAITYQGKRYSLAIAWAERDFVWDVIQYNKVKVK